MTILGTDGNDTLLGGEGHDWIEGDAGHDVLNGYAGDDALFGGVGNDRLISGIGLYDVLDGGEGDDRLDARGSVYADLYGGAGNDVYILDQFFRSSHTIREALGGGVDQLNVDVYSIDLPENVENLVMMGNNAEEAYGNALSNVMTGNSRDNYLRGGGGNDTIYGGGGDDYLQAIGQSRLVGGAGNDVYQIVSGSPVLVEVAGEGVDTVLARVSVALDAEIERLDFSLAYAGTLIGIGNASHNTMTGHRGSDSLYGGHGNDTLLGGDGNDRLDGDQGDDHLIDFDTSHGSEGGQDYFYGGAGNDRLDAGSGNDHLEGGTGDDTYILAAAGDTVVEAVGGGTDRVEAVYSYRLAANIEDLVLLWSAPSGTGNALDNQLIGNRTDNMLLGQGGNDTLFGEAGHDTLDGGEGADLLEGGSGNDSYVLQVAEDTIVEVAGGGRDEVRAGTSYTLGGNLEFLKLTGTADLKGTGNELANRLTGNAGLNVLMGEAGNDTLLGGAGNDILEGGAGSDRLEGGTGSDTYFAQVGDVLVEAAGSGIADFVRSSSHWKLVANFENLELMGMAALNGTGNGIANRLTGNGASNLLRGGAGNDRLLGQAGYDRLNGEIGQDKLTGGVGNDVFVFTSRAEAKDVITDFHNTSGDNDRFHINAAAFGGGLVGGRQASASQFQMANDNVLQGTAEANFRFIFEVDATKLWFDSNGSGAGGLVLVADLQAGATVTAGDIWLV
ncbi:hypothetical protein FHG66_19870 [Rubellimicrobium rubrum]|uniref:Calcium-binding protein n=1 Tax=Rubellimicrobium rubrum TaxID=2585369 RepID=A0A5C4MNL4_9RHOB|nr:hypothetical protein [Rubellimicrobium rubrum]TNC45933.1 hypothetical protein FHG66_19870 [Rubellimicrobium rubrum]